MAYKTGRSRTLSIVIAITGTAIKTDWSYLPPPVGDPDPTPPGPLINVNGKITVSTGWAEGTVEPKVIKDPTIAGNQVSVLDVTVYTAWGTTQTLRIYQSDTQPVPFPSYVLWSEDIGGSFTGSVDMEEWVDVTFDALPTGGDITAQMAVEPPASCTVRFYEKTKMGGNAHLSGYGVSSSGTIYSEVEIGYTVSTHIQMNVDGYTMTWSAESTYAGVAIQAPISFTDSDGSGGHSNGNTLTVHGATGITTTRVLNSGIQPSKTYNLQGRINALHQPYPDALKVFLIDHTDNSGSPVSRVIDAAGGAYNAGYTQHSYDISSTFPHDTAHVLQEFSSITHKLQAASLLTAGEIVANDRLSFRGWTWNGCNITQASSQDVDVTPAASHWTQGAHTSVSGSGPLVISVNSSGAGSVSTTLAQAPAVLKGTDWTGVDLSGYGFLQLTLNHTSGNSSAYMLSIGGKTWTHDRNGKPLKTGSSPVVINLCGPDGAVGDTDATDTQWPWGAGFTTAGDGWAYGCHNVTGLSISGLHSDQAYSLGALTLRQFAPVALSILPVYNGWVQAYPEASVGETTTYTYYRRTMEAYAGGAQVLEWTGDVWIHTESSSASSDTYSPITLQDLVTLLHSGNSGTLPRKGFDMSGGVADPADGGNLLRNNFLNNSRWSGYLWGAGLYYAGGWHTGLDKALGSQTAQFLCEIVDFYPGAGDVFGTGGSYGATTALYAGCVLRGNSIGLVVDDVGKASKGSVVSVRNAGTTTMAGSGTTNGTGQYRDASHAGTGSVFGKGGQSYDTKTDSVPQPNITRTFNARYRHRACFRVVAPVLTCCQTIFCSDHFFFPFALQAGDHTRLPLEDWRAIPDVSNASNEEEEGQQQESLGTDAK